MFATAAISKARRSNETSLRYEEVHTPVAAAAAREVIWFQHSLLLGEEDLLNDVAASVQSLRRPRGQVFTPSTGFAAAPGK